MFRTALFSIVFSLAAGPDVSVLCRTWCDAHAPAASDCHHSDGSTGSRVVLGQDCDDVVTTAVGVVREGLSPAGAQQAIPVPRYQLAQLNVDANAAEAWWWRHSSLDKRPLATALRI